MSLNHRTPEPTPYVNVLLYGDAKTGKTIGAASAPGRILYLNADLPNATLKAHEIYGPSMDEVTFEGLVTLADIHQAVWDPQGGYATVVIDPVGEVHRCLMDAQSDRAIRVDVRIYGDVAKYVERFCRDLCEAPINVVLVCHENQVKDEATGRLERMPWTGTNNTSLGNTLLRMVDVIGYTGVRIEGEGDDRSKRYVSALIPAQGTRGGTRFEVLGDWRDTNLSEWFRLIAEAAEDNQGTTTPQTTQEVAP